MTNRQPRSRSGNRAASPTPCQVRAAREAAGLTVAQAASLIHKTARAWQRWEDGTREMDPALFELFCLKTQQKEIK